MSSTKISVVIPTYNAEKYIKQCIDASLGQTYENIEVIVIDDGSKDNTLSICREIEKTDSRLRVHSQENGGASAARNAGLDLATGDYVVFFDADDFPEKTIIEEYVNAIESNDDKDVGLIVAGMYFDKHCNKHVSSKKKILEVAYGYAEGENYLLSRSAAAMLAWLRIFNFVTNKCYKLSRLNDNNIRFDKVVNIGEDLQFNLDYIECSDGYINVINKPLYHYIMRKADSLSVSYHENDLEDTKRIYTRFIDWEMSQDEVVEDNILVIKGIYLYDWVRRFAAMYSAYRSGKASCEVKKTLNREMKSKEFQKLLKETYGAGKVSTLRYVCLRTGSYRLFYLVRCIYQFVKG